MAQRATQRNNGSPKGYGQPGKSNVRRALMRPEDEEIMGLSPEVGDVRLAQQEDAPTVYPNQPTYTQPRQGRVEDLGVRTGVTGAVRGGQSPYGNVDRSQLNPRTPTSQPQNHNYAMPGTQPAGGSGYQNIGGVPQVWNHPGYQQGTTDPFTAGLRDQLTGQGVLPGNAQPQFPSSIAQAANQAMQNGYTDIEGAQGYFQPGNFMSQLSGFNTGGWNTGERGTQTLKNTMGQLFSNYDVTQPGALAKVVQDPKLLAMYPDATVGGPKQDLLDLDGPNGPMEPVDVIQAAGENGAGTAWAWMPTADGGGNQFGGPMGPSSMIYQQALPQALNTQPVGDPQQLDENSVMQLLQWLMQAQNQDPNNGGNQGLI